MAFEIRIDLTNEAPWVNSWCGFRATVTNTGSEASGSIELQYVCITPSYELARGGMGPIENLEPYQSVTTDEFNIQPLDAGEHTLTVAVWKDGNEQGSASHTFTVQ